MAEDNFAVFMKEVKQIEEKDSIYTSEKQIARLLRPGSSYANLNPFEVLMVEPEASPEVIRKQYKKLSILLHPDKNPHDRERSQSAFDIVTKAYKALGDEAMRSKALEVVEEAVFKVKQSLEDKRRKLRKEQGKKDAMIEEDVCPEKMKEAIRVMTMKLFAEYERKRRGLEERAADERKRKREEEIQEETNKKMQQEWNKNYEESRETRVSNWQTFQKNAKSKGSTKGMFRPPKPKLN